MLQAAHLPSAVRVPRIFRVRFVSSGSIEFKFAFRYREEGAFVTMRRVAMSLENIIIGSISPQRVEDSLPFLPDSVRSRLASGSCFH